MLHVFSKGKVRVSIRGHTFHHSPFLLRVHAYPSNTFRTGIGPEDFLIH